MADNTAPENPYVEINPYRNKGFTFHFCNSCNLFYCCVEHHNKDLPGTDVRSKSVWKISHKGLE